MILNKDRTKLEIFERFVVDKNLPKYTEQEEEVKKKNSGRMRYGNTSVPESGTAWRSSTSSTGDTTRTYVIYSNGASSIDGVATDSKDQDRGLPVSVKDTDVILTFEQFFGHIRNSSGIISNLRFRRKVKALEKILKQCDSTGQQHMKDVSLLELDRVRREYVLAANGFREYVDERDVVRGFAHLSADDQSRIELEWVKNFGRLIPSKIVKRKMKADRLHIFDNYVVLHIAPGWYGDRDERLTAEEVDRMKDPILFGVMDSSRRLYYIGDWVDEHCDLNMADLVERFGDGVDTVNDVWSRTNPRLPFDAQLFDVPKLKDVN